MATSLILGGLFNITDPVLHIQIYIWMWVGACVLALILHAIFWYGSWKPYTPLHGLYWAWKAGSNAALIFDKALHGEMVSERIAKCIFDYSKEVEYESWLERLIGYYPAAYLDNITPLQAIVYRFGKVNKDVEIARKLQNGEWERTPSVTCGGVDVDIIVDAGNWTIRTSPEHIAIERCAREWNELNPHNQIHSYSKFQRYLLERRLQCDGVQLTYFVDWTRIDKALSGDMEATEYVGKTIQMAEQDYSADQISKNRMALYIFGASVMGWFVIGVVRLVTHFF